MGKCILTDSPLALPEFEWQIITANKAIASYLKVPHYSLENLARNIVRRQGIRIASTLLSRRLLQNAVREVIKTKDVAGTATAFYSTVKEVLRSGIDLAKLQQNNDPRIQQLGQLAVAYQRQLRSGHIDAAELYWQAQTHSYPKAYLFYGYFTPAVDELGMINAIAGENSILVLPIDDLYPRNWQALSWLQSQGWELLPSQRSSGIGQQLQQCFKQQSKQSTLPRGVSLHTFANLEAEVRGVLSQVKVLLAQGVAARNIVLATNDDRLYGSLVLDIAWEYNLPVEVCYEIPLAQTRLGAWLNLLLEVIRDDFPFEATAKLLSHPLADYLSEELWSQARQTHPHGLAAWQELGIDLSLLNFRVKQRRDWMNWLLNILAGWEVLEKAKSWAIEIVAYYRLQDAIKELSKPAQQLSKAVFIREITEVLSILTIPAQPGRGGIELHCLTSLLGTNYAHVFVLGTASGILPTAIADNLILDIYHRKQLAQQGLKLETAVDLAQKAIFNFYCLLNVPTQSITFSYPEAIANQPTLPSPYLSHLGLQPSTLDLPIVSLERARQLYLRQPSDNSFILPETIKAWQVETARESAIAPDCYDGVIGIGIDPQRKFSASQLTQLGQCPFKWFSARLLKLQELVEAESDLSAAVRGNLYHRCLELSLLNVKTASDLAEFNQEQLERAFATAEGELGLTQLPGWDAQRGEHLNLLSLNLTTTEFLPPEREVIATETRFETQWYGLQVRGQVDRIDRTDTGLSVIDYKTSSVPAGVKDAAGKAKLDLQLAVYQDAIAQQYPDETIAVAYYSLSQQKIISRPHKEPAELAAFAERVKSHLERGYYPVAPDVDRKACRYCDYDLVCRKGDRLSRKPS